MLPCSQANIKILQADITHLLKKGNEQQMQACCAELIKFVIRQHMFFVFCIVLFNFQIKQLKKFNYNYLLYIFIS